MILKSPIHIRDTELHNRLVMPPMATEKSGANGMVSDQLCSYYDEKTKGGYIGLVICEHSYILPEGKATPGQVSMADDAVIPGLCRLTNVIHKNGSRVFAQINHAGGATRSSVTGQKTLGPSLTFVPRKQTKADLVMTREDIDRTIRAFAAAAARVKEAGFDGVEIHSAHGYLLNEFYSPLTNLREDEYSGKTIDGRIRLHLEVIAAVRDAVGPDFPVALRLGACDYAEGGSTVSDAVSAAKAFEQAGVDLIDISGGIYGYTNPYSRQPGYFSEASEAVKKAVGIPVILTGGITDADTAEKLLQEGKADLIGVGRAILKDSRWPETAIGSQSGR